MWGIFLSSQNEHSKGSPLEKKPLIPSWHSSCDCSLLYSASLNSSTVKPEVEIKACSVPALIFYLSGTDKDLRPRHLILREIPSGAPPRNQGGRRRGPSSSATRGFLLSRA